MKKSRLFAGCMAVVALALASASCTMPDYQLSTEVSVPVITPVGLYSFAAFSYVFTNIGDKNLSNVQVYVHVLPFAGSIAGSPSSSQLLGPFTINAGDYESGSGSINIGLTSNGYDSAQIFIDSVGWDDDDNSMWN